MSDGDEPATRGPEPDAWAAPTEMVACPTCEGTGQQLPADGRPCAMCAGSGLVTAEAAKTIIESEEMEAGPPGDG